MRRLIILQKKALWIMNLKTSYFIQAHFSLQITSWGLVIKLHYKIFRQRLSIFYDWFTFSGNWSRYENSRSVTNHLYILTLRTQKYGRLSIRSSAIRSWNYVRDMSKTNFLLKNSNPKSVKYFLPKYFIESY